MTTNKELSNPVDILADHMRRASGCTHRAWFAISEAQREDFRVTAKAAIAAMGDAPRDGKPSPTSDLPSEISLDINKLADDITRIIRLQNGKGFCPGTTSNAPGLGIIREIYPYLRTTEPVTVSLKKRLKTAIGGLRSIAYGEAHTWPNCSSREVAKQALIDCGGEKYVD